MHPTKKPICDDDADFAALETPRVGKPGWCSWGFAYESMDNCSEDGFRDILGHRVSCVNGWQCEERFRGSVPLVRPSEIAEVARHSQVTVLSNWVNDVKHRYACFNGTVLTPDEYDAITVDSLLRLIRGIHAVNPDVVVVVLGKYPGAAGVQVGSALEAEGLNTAVQRGLEGEPNTLFANFTFPPELELYQHMTADHPNCRGDRVLATAIVEALFRGGVLARGLAMAPPEECLAAASCDSLSPACCQRSALCWPAANGTCAPYGPGLQ
mmetsp:Transcript_13836/g.42844  ORF Transcript_13836/g.42844 Transcript_13836/m.42844 type:complete len:268 (-) Transcript_13836:80-883(-)